MNYPLAMEIQFLCVTPAFVGNAHQQAELRPQSLKGILRSWYRAVGADLVTGDKGGADEDRLWGGAGDGYGQSRVLLRVINRKKPQIWRWQKDLFRDFSSGSGKHLINGAWYLGYPFGMKGNDLRTALAAGTMFTLQAVIPRPGDFDTREINSVLACFWLLAQFGSFGSRCRRGFGSLQAMGWSLASAGENPLWTNRFSLLPEPGKANSPKEWRQQVEQGLAVIHDWCGSFPASCAHPHIGPDFHPILLQGYTSWQEALARAGEEMQRFRRRRQPDYQRVRDLLADFDRSDHQAPERAEFGLPLTFRFTSGSNRGPVRVLPLRYHEKANLSNRFASLLYLRVIRLGIRYHPQMFLFNGMVPGLDTGVGAMFRGRHTSLEPASHSALDEFYQQMTSESIV